jgi:hypothetical protein
MSRLLRGKSLLVGSPLGLALLIHGCALGPSDSFISVGENAPAAGTGAELQGAGGTLGGANPEGMSGTAGTPQEGNADLEAAGSDAGGGKAGGAPAPGENGSDLEAAGFDGAGSGTAGSSAAGSNAAGSSAAGSSAAGSTSEGTLCAGGPLVSVESEALTPPFDHCEGAETSRFCFGDRVWYCGWSSYGAIEDCAPGTCATGCCHAEGDPCPVNFESSLAAPTLDCNGDCGGGCDDPAISGGKGFAIVRVGANLPSVSCGSGVRRYVDFELTGPSRRLAVEPPWSLIEYGSAAECTELPARGCLISVGDDTRTITAVSDRPDPPPRNIVIEQVREEAAACP